MNYVTVKVKLKKFLCKQKSLKLKWKWIFDFISTSVTEKKIENVLELRNRAFTFQYQGYQIFFSAMT